MDSALPPWLWRWLNLPAGQLLAMQWLGLSILAVLTIGWLWQDKGQQRARIATQRRQLMQQIEQRQRQLAQIPAMETMDRHWQLATEPPAGQGDLTEALQQAGATLLHWQRLEKPLRQTLSLRTDYAGLLTLMQVLPAGLRIEQINIEMQSENMTVRFVLQDATGGMSMSKRRWLGLLLLPWVLAAQPRNPFIPLPDCLMALESPAGWRLKGIIGQPALRYGWVVTPAGQWLRLRPQQILLAGRWRVDQINADKLTLAEQPTDPDCPVAIGHVQLMLNKS